MRKLTIIRTTDSHLVDRAVETLKKGQLLIFPTETCYGVGVDATNQKAVDKLLAYKMRREGKPISIAVSDKEMAKRYVIINNTAQNLYDNYLPGPLTVVSKGLHKVAQGIESEYGTLGIRIPDYPIVLDIIKKLGKPITATSANVSYEKKPYSIEALLNHLPRKNRSLLSLIIDAGQLPHNEVSTVVDTTLNDLAIIREGQISFSTNKNKPIFRIKTASPEETQNFASMVMLRFLDHLQIGPIVFALGGELGSGKTQFAKGLASNLGITKIVKSPTFTLVLPYTFIQNAQKRRFVHVDTWRLENSKEFKALHLEHYLKSPNVIAIEWADKFYNEILNFAQIPRVLMIKIHFTHIDREHRKIVVELENKPY